MMIPWIALSQKLAGHSSQYVQLKDKFAEFAVHVATQMHHPAFHIKGITVSLHLADCYFTVAFVGRIVRFEYRTEVGESAAFKGLVDCYLLARFPAKDPIKLTGFTFNGGGQTELIEPGTQDSLNIAWDSSAAHIALDVINQALSK